MNTPILEEVLQAFLFHGEISEIKKYGLGHINETYLVETKDSEGIAEKYILQRINTDIFKKPEQVMENIVNVTEYMKDIITKKGGDPERETLNVVYAKDGKAYFVDQNGGYWRGYLFVKDTVCLQQVEKPEDFYASAKSFGYFLKQLDKFPAEKLHETIENFHHTPTRFQNFLKAVEKDEFNRAKDVQAEIQFVLDREKDCSYLTDRLEQGALPLRVTHNDTKLNNILLDKATGEGLCIIDLDTIMPGLSVTDYGDSIRFGAATAAEDEVDLDKMHFDISLFEIFTKGYLEATKDVLTEEEKNCLIWGAKLMTLECGMRFLADYLEGDIYFKIHREAHNLDRARTQFKLVSEMEAQWEAMQKIVEKYL